MTKEKKIRRELLDELLAGYSKPEDLTGPEGLLKRLSDVIARVVEGCMGPSRRRARIDHRLRGAIDDFAQRPGRLRLWP
jgi:hypothetical protein